MTTIYKYSKAYKNPKKKKEVEFKFIRKFNVMGSDPIGFKMFVNYIKTMKSENEKILYSGAKSIIVCYYNNKLGIYEDTKYSIIPPSSKEWL